MGGLCHFFSTGCRTAVMAAPPQVLEVELLLEAVIRQGVKLCFMVWARGGGGGGGGVVKSSGQASDYISQDSKVLWKVVEC